MTTPKKPVRPRRSRAAARSRKACAPEPAPEPLLEAASTEPLVSADEPPPTVDVEPLFVARVPPPGARPPLPSTRRAVFFDVENTSRAEHVMRVLRHLALDWETRATELIAVGNWRVIGHDTARLLARHGAQLVHSAPSVGVRDWSDLRIAVAAGAWLATTRPGDVLEIITDDQAFDAVGDVAASLGVGFHRLSYRGLAGAGEIPVEEPVRERDHGSRRRRRGGRRGGRSEGPPRHPAVAHGPVVPTSVNGRTGGEEPHTAPHDELLAVARELIEASEDRSVSLDALSNALKARGFSRPPGSPRLVTRLRRIKELEVGRQGTIRLVAPVDGEPEEPIRGGGEPSTVEGGEPSAEPAATSGGPRRRRRRGGRRRRGRGGSRAPAETPADAGS